MSRKLLCSLLCCLVLALPAGAVPTPAADPVAEKSAQAAPHEPTERVIVIRTAKDPKATQVKVGEKGEILIPQSTAGLAGTVMVGAAGGGAVGPPAGVPEAGEEAKGGADTKSAEDTGFKSASGSSGGSRLGDIKTPALSSGQAASGGGLPVGGGAVAGGGGTGTNPVAPVTAGIYYFIAASAGTNGSISPSGTVWVYAGLSQTFTITANTGYLVADVLVDGVSVGAVTSYIFSNIVANHTIVASFTTPVVVCTITASAGPHGSISPTGATTVSSGSSQTFTITPDPGYRVAEVLVDGASVGAVTSYTFNNVTTNHTIAATFATALLPTAGLQQLLDQTVSDSGIPGAVMAVQTPTETWIGAAGKADLGDAAAGRDPRDMTPATQVRLAGVTRFFTATLIMKLVENGLKLDGTVESILATNPDIGLGAVPSGDKITVRMLLNHTSGLHDFENLQDFLVGPLGLLASPKGFRDPFSSIPAYIGQNPVDFTPGTDFKDCSSDYYLLGLVADPDYPLKNDTVDDMFQEKFCGPLNLAHTSLSRSGFYTSEPFTRNYSWVGISPYNTALTDTTGWDLSSDWTNGSGISTAQDILTFTQALFRDKQVISDKEPNHYLTEMVTVNPSQEMPKDRAVLFSYGYGLEVVSQDPWFGEPAYQCGGETVGAYARWVYYPNSGRTIFIAFNRDDKRFNTDPALNPAPSPPQVDASGKADELLKAAAALITAPQ